MKKSTRKIYTIVTLYLIFATSLSAQAAFFVDDILNEEIASFGKTRFLVITHHRLTMAKMDRLFGVTMGESGVSQLVSVDLRVGEGLEAAE